ncbi:mast cell carboxypeptidase A-like [Portunus trituberculatus]|uniref:mast cell carboxypeptidase A-like n=1 Tax=Portunus trituberculatus TaxID=210409 RepID=UPI001E1CEDBA|nr:mast cell carboxypeptidase A-like [Portunus trituberculatus]
MGYASAVFVLVVTVAAVLVVGMPVDTFQPVSYLGWKVLEVRLGEAAEKAPPGTQAVNLDDFDDSTTVNILNQNRRTGVAEVAVSPEALNDITTHLTQNQVPFSTKLEDLGREIFASIPVLRVEPDLRGAVTFNRYMTYDEIEAYVAQLPQQHPTKVKVEVAGKSVEGRTIHLITVTDNVAKKDTLRKPSIFIDGGIHAREWISPSTAVGIVDNLLKTPELTNGIEWRVIPVVNPDGYVMSWEKDRLWRKNKAKGRSKRCTGVDLNRNFGYKWGGRGSSDNQCSNIYRGKNAFSEPEAQAVRDAVLREADRTKAYITFHSYGQMILHPWGYSSRVSPPSNKLGQVGDAMANAINTETRKKYEVGSAAGVLYAAAGGSDDWASGAANIPLSYTIELRDTGSGGFLLPTSEITSTVTDAWVAMKVLAGEVMKSGVLRGQNPDSLQQEGIEDTEVTQEGDFQPPSRVNQEPEGENVEVQSEGVVPVNENQGGQVTVNRNQETVNQNQQNQGAANKNQEPVNENQESQAAVNTDQETVNQNQENQEPVNENQGTQAAVNRNQETVNQNQENQEPVNENQGTQAAVNSDQETVNENQESQGPVNRNQETVNKNQGNQVTIIENQEPVIEIQGGQVAVHRDQEPGTDPQVVRGTQQISAESIEMETEGSSSLETLRTEHQHSPQFYSHIGFSPQFRDAFEPLNEAPRSPETQSTFRLTPGGSVHLKTLREDLSASSEEDDSDE